MRKRRKINETQSEEHQYSEIVLKAGAYLRISQAEPGQKAESVDNQRRIIEDYVRCHPDIEVKAFYRDIGASGRSFERDPVFEIITPSWLDRAHVYTGFIGENGKDFRFRFEQKNKATTILASVYSVWCYEVAKDVHEKEFLWNDAGIAEMRDWLQHFYDLYIRTGSLSSED